MVQAVRLSFGVVFFLERHVRHLSSFLCTLMRSALTHRRSAHWLIDQNSCKLCPYVHVTASIKS